MKRWSRRTRVIFIGLWLVIIVVGIPIGLWLNIVFIQWATTVSLP